MFSARERHLSKYSLWWSSLIYDKKKKCKINSNSHLKTLQLLTTIGYLLMKVFFRLQIIPWSVFPFLLRVSTGNWGQTFFYTFSQFMTLTTPSQQRALMVRGSATCEHSTWLKTTYRFRNSAPTRGEEWFLHPFVLTREIWSNQCWPRLYCNQPRQLPCARHVMTMPAHHPPISPFFCQLNMSPDCLHKQAEKYSSHLVGAPFLAIIS